MNDLDSLGQRMTELEAEVARVKHAVDTMAWWLVQAQTGFGERDARGIADILNGDDEGSKP